MPNMWLRVIKSSVCPLTIAGKQGEIISPGLVGQIMDSPETRMRMYIIGKGKTLRGIIWDWKAGFLEDLVHLCSMEDLI